MTDTLFPARLPGTTVLGILSTTNNVDLTAAASTNLYTPNGKSAIVTGVMIRITTVTAFVTAASASIGQNASVNDIIPITALTGLNAVTLYFPISPIAISMITPSGTPIKFKVTTQAVATALLASIDLIGYLV
jgi:hypothetical protein